MLRTKVVCTLGPASSDPDTVLAMVRGGMNLARINMSHGRREHHSATIAAVRAAAAEVGRPVAILVDLAGPKIRVGEIRGGSIELGETLGKNSTSPSIYTKLLQAIRNAKTWPPSAPANTKPWPRR